MKKYLLNLEKSLKIEKNQLKFQKFCQNYVIPVEDKKILANFENSLKIEEILK